MTIGSIKKHVSDQDKFPRLDGYFSKVPPKRKSSADGIIEEPAAKRIGSDDETTLPPAIQFATASEPPEVAPAASSYLLGKGGIISQSLSALKSGNLLCLLILNATARLRVGAQAWTR